MYNAGVASSLKEVHRFPVLDGWRGISILLVLVGHLLPLGPKSLNINESVAALGMAIFFALSGFLITTTLLSEPNVYVFLIRRLCRIVPLAWCFTVVALAYAGVSAEYYIAQLFFFANLPPFWLTGYTGHLWSLCVEMQFYVGIALVVLVFGRRGLYAMPIICVLVTANRIHEHVLISIVTSVRLDEILAGSTLALLYYCDESSLVRKLLSKGNPYILMLFAGASSNQLLGAIGYLRPYLVAGMIGTTLLNEGKTEQMLRAKWLAYLAAISYALYILHFMVTWGYLGSGTKMIKYLKRIPEIAVVFGLANLSTFYFERFWVRKGRQWSKLFKSSSTGTVPI